MGTFPENEGRMQVLAGLALSFQTVENPWPAKLVRKMIILN
jgi:hypothetical protein